VDSQRLIRMANQIGDFFEAEADRTIALEGVAGHLKRFWDPRMRREILRHLDEKGGEGLRPMVLEALRAHRALIEAGTAAPART
jgi:formate dehydrogenase subunit delta